MASDSERRALLEQLIQYVPPGAGWKKILKAALKGQDAQIGIHIAVCVQPFLSAILEGRKTVESRFSNNRCPPYQRVQRGDIIILKSSGGPALGTATAGSVHFYELSTTVLAKIRRNFAEELYALNDEFWDERANKQFATLIELHDVTPITPMPITKRDRRGWITYKNLSSPRES